jgi:cellulose synthase/poly-beta-1,6-N-acetylglucosamine synthase-like glycosyltransferase
MKSKHPLNMVYLYFVLSFLFVVVFIYLSFTATYLFTVALAAVIRKRKLNSSDVSLKRIAILLPSYKEDGIVLDTVKSLIDHNYPRESFQLFVIADSLKPITISKLREMDCSVIEVSFDISTKAKSLHAALNYINEDEFDIALILDADNILAPDCLRQINQAFNSGVHAVQCHRIAKNENTPLAVLDAINEEINNRLLRKGQWALGFSATASGSGMAFNFKLLKEIFNMPHILNNNGEDKEIDIQLLRRKIKMAYLDNALVLDEKVSSFNAFRKQRLRWVEAYMNYVFRLFYKDLRTSSGRFEFWNRFFQLIVLPRSLYLIILFVAGVVFTAGYYFKFPFYHPSPWLLLAFGLLYFLTLFICLPASYVNWRTMRSLALLPSILMTMVITVAKVKPGRKEFIHTPKSYTETKFQ